MHEPLIRRRSQDMDAPYLINTSISYERKLPPGIVCSVTYGWQRGVHLLRTRKVNAPLSDSGARPIPDQGPSLDKIVHFHIIIGTQCSTLRQSLFLLAIIKHQSFLIHQVSQLIERITSGSGALRCHCFDDLKQD